MPTNEDPFEIREPAAVMDLVTRRQLFRSPHVHDPDGTCVRNRFGESCDAPYVPDDPSDQR